MIVGDVVPQSVIRVDRPNVKATFKPDTGKVAMLLLLGEADKKDPDSFDSVKAMNDLGWVKAEPAEAMHKLLQELYDAHFGQEVNDWWGRIEKVLELYKPVQN